MEILLKLSSVDLELMQIYKRYRAKTGGEIYGFSFLISGLPTWLSGKESACHMGDLGTIPVLGRFPEEGKGYPLQDSGPENSMDWIVHVVPESGKTEWL